MNIKEFEYLVAIAETQSLTKAANSLYMTQSALSKFIVKIETETGIPLFHREGKQFVLTDAGEKCVNYAKQIIALNSRMGETLRVMGDTKSRIRLAFRSSYSDFFFAKVFPLFQAKHPHVHLEIHEANGTPALKMIEKGELDFALVLMEKNTHPHFICEPLSMHHVALVAREDHPLVQQAQIHPEYSHPLVEFEWCKNEPWIVRHPKQNLRTITDELFDEHSTFPHIIFEASNMSNVLSAVERSAGISLCMDSSVLLVNRENIRFLSFKEGQRIVGYTNIIYHPEASFSEAQKDLLQMIEEEYHKLG